MNAGAPASVPDQISTIDNDAMHADWNKIDRVGVGTVIALVQVLLLKHFS